MDNGPSYKQITQEIEYLNHIHTFTMDFLHL